MVMSAFQGASIVPCMVDNPHDDHCFVVDHVENSVSSMDRAAHADAEFRAADADIWMGRQTIKSLIEAHKIGVGHIRAEVFETVKADIDQIVSRLRAEIQFSHDQRGGRS